MQTRASSRRQLIQCDGEIGRLSRGEEWELYPKGLTGSALSSRRRNSNFMLQVIGHDMVTCVIQKVMFVAIQRRDCN